MSTGSDVKHEDQVISTVRPTRGQKFKAHWRKWWWAHAIALAVGAVVAVIVAVYGVVPPVAQKLIDKTWLTVHSFEITDPTGNSFALSMNSTIKGAGGMAKDADLDPMDVKLFLDKGKDQKEIRPVFELPIPRTHGGGDIHIVQDDVFIEITDEEALNEFSMQLLFNYDMRVGLRGRTTVHLGAIKTDVNYNEVVTLKALNKLAGMTITKYTPVPRPEDGFNIVGEVMIPNPTITTVYMGDVSLKIGLNGTDLGVGVVPGLVLTPGNNTYNFKSAIPEDKIIPMAFAENRKNPLTIGSNGTSINGTKIEWLSKPLEALTSQVLINQRYFEQIGEEAPEPLN